MTPATVGWIVLGVFCVAALAFMLAGALRVAGAQRAFKARLARLEAKQRSTFDAVRLEAALTRISRDAQTAKELLARAQSAVATIGVAIRYAVIAVRVVKSLT